MQIVYIEALLMDNEEVLHHGKTLGFANQESMHDAKLDGTEVKIVRLK